MVRSTRPLGLTLTLLAAIWAGCLAPADEDQAGGLDRVGAGEPTADPGTDAGGDPSPSVVEPSDVPEDQILVGGGTALACLPPDTGVKVNQTRNFAGNAHTHDMWGGLSEVVIYEGPITKFGGGGWFDMPNAVVYPGTGRVDFKIWWNAVVPEAVQGAVQPLRETRIFYYDMPGDERTTTNMFALTFTNGQNHSFPIDIKNNDPPHYSRSTWTFKMSESTEFRIRWTIQRGYDCLPIDPPHYDQWGGLNQKTLFEGVTKHDATYVCPGNACVSSGTFYGFKPAGENVVPIGTGRMVVTITWGANDGIPIKMGLEIAPPSVKGGSTSAVWKRPQGAQDQGSNKRSWDISLAPEDWDSAYALSTAWMFRWFPDNGSAAYTAVGETGKYKGDVNWKIEIFKAAQ